MICVTFLGVACIMITISLCMIVRDEEAVLARCLESVRGVADEIVVVDTGSVDATKEIARRFTDKIYDFVWTDDFSEARNFAFSKGTKDYLFWLDADDVLLEEDRKETLPADTDAVLLNYNTGFDPQGRPVFSYFRERLFRRSCGFLWKGAVHEAVEISGNVRYENISVTHSKLKHPDSDRNLRIYEKQKAQGKPFSPRDLFYYGRELYYHRRDSDAAEVLEQFLRDGQGWLENNVEACHVLSAVYERMGEKDRALRTLFRTLTYDSPRAEICCEIGRLMMEKEEYRAAIFWYETAAAQKPDILRGGFVQLDCYGYIPFLQLCVCCDRLGDYNAAHEYNLRALRIRPNDPAALSNEAYFQSLLSVSPQFPHTDTR